MVQSKLLRRWGLKFRSTLRPRWMIERSVKKSSDRFKRESRKLDSKLVQFEREYLSRNLSTFKVVREVLELLEEQRRALENGLENLMLIDSATEQDALKIQEEMGKVLRGAQSIELQHELREFNEVFLELLRPAHLVDGAIHRLVLGNELQRQDVDAIAQSIATENALAQGNLITEKRIYKGLLNDLRDRIKLIQQKIEPDGSLTKRNQGLIMRDIAEYKEALSAIYLRNMRALELTMKLAEHLAYWIHYVAHVLKQMQDRQCDVSEELELLEGVQQNFNTTLERTQTGLRAIVHEGQKAA